MSKKIDGGTIEFKANAKGLEKVSQQADKAGKSLKNTGKSAQSADRSLKGAAQASSNSTKNFSKMSQGITGGLVPAYATLAANLFALDAAFRFLKGAADFRVLREGQVAFAAATGIAYQSLSKDIQAATRGMISFSEASQAAAIGRAAGLSSGQLRELSEAAFTVSVALGRDVTDSFNRLVRGVTKAEPELLDELGIILRLEEASTKYAAALGLNKNQLSIYQKSQAVVNEVLGQAEEKFGKINEIMDPTANALAQVGIAFDELLNKVRPAIAAIAEPMAKFIAGNTTNAAIAMGLFASSIIKSLIPSTNELRIRQADAAEARIAEIERLKLKEEELAAKVKQLSSPSLAQNKFARKLGADRLGAGGKLGAQIADGKKLSKAQISNLHSQHKREIGMFKNMSDKKRDYYKKILLQMTKEHDTFITKNVARSQQGAAQIHLFFSRSAANIKAIFNVVSVAASKVGMFLSGLMGYAAVISMLYMAFRAFMQYLNKDANKILENFNERVDASKGSIATLNEELLKMSQVRADGLIGSGEQSLLHTFEAVQSVDFAKITGDLLYLGRISDINSEKFRELEAEFATTITTLAKLDSRFADLNEEILKAGKLTPALTVEMIKLKDAIGAEGAAIKALNNNAKEMVKQQNRISQSLPKVPFQDMLNLFDSNIQQYKELIKTQSQYQAHLDRETAKLQLYTYFQTQAVELQKKMAKSKTLSLFGDLAGMTTLNKTLKVEEKRFKLQGEILKLDQLNLQVQTETDDKKLKALNQQIAAQYQVIHGAKIAYDLEEKRSSLMFSTYHGVYKDLEANLGKAIGAGMRGDSSMFDNIGKAFTTTITDAIGGFLSEQLLEDTLGAVMPTGKTEAEKLDDAATRHGRIIKENIIESGFTHGMEIKGAGDSIANNLRTIQRNILQGEIDVETMRGARLAKDLEAHKTKMDIIGGLDHESEVRSLKENPAAFNKHMQTTQVGSLGAQARSRAENLLNLQKQLQVESNIPQNKGSNAAKGMLMKKVDGSLVYMTFAELNLMQRKTESYTNADGETRKRSVYGNGITEAGPQQDSASGHLATVSKEINELLYGGDKDKFIGTFFNRLLSEVPMRAQEFMTAENKKSSLETAIAGSGEKVTGFKTTMGNLENVSTSLTPAQALAAWNILEPGQYGFNPQTQKFEWKQPAGNGTEQSVGDGTVPYKDEGKGKRDEFSKNLNQFSGVIGLMGAVAGQEDKTAKIMAKVAQIQLMITMYERAKMALATGGGTFLGTMAQFFTGTVPTGRDGGVMSKGYRSFSGGGVSDGPSSGYGAVLHGKEAVVPLPNNRSIPVELSGKNNGPVNTTINVNMADGSSDTTSDEETGKQFAQAINMAVLEEIGKQQRPGGLLSG